MYQPIRVARTVGSTINFHVVRLGGCFKHLCESLQKEAREHKRACRVSQRLGRVWQGPQRAHSTGARGEQREQTRITRFRETRARPLDWPRTLVRSGFDAREPASHSADDGAASRRVRTKHAPNRHEPTGATDTCNSICHDSLSKHKPLLCAQMNKISGDFSECVFFSISMQATRERKLAVSLEKARFPLHGPQSEGLSS